MPEPGAVLDEFAAAVFDGRRGRARLDPLLARFDEAVGRILDDDAHRETLLAIRLDWALCDAAIEGGRGPGDTWLRRVLAGQVEGVPARESWRDVAGTYVGLFEVWPARRPFLRDRLRGLCVAVADPIDVEPLEPESASRTVAGLWEVRLTVDDDGGHLCRDPLPYPLELGSWLEDLQIDRFGPGGAPTSLMRLRRRWLQFSRARHADPMTIFNL